MQQSPCDITAYHAYNGSEIASSRKLYNWVFVTQKKIKIYTSSIPSKHSFSLRKQKLIFATKAPFNYIELWQCVARKTTTH